MDYENLALEGGGMRGVAYAGAIQALEDLGIRKTLRRFTGSSIGSLYASLLAMDVPADKIVKNTLEIDMSRVRTNPCILIKIYRLFKHFGIDKHELISDFIRWSFRSCGIDPTITFKQGYRLTKKDLFIPGTNINRNKVYYFSRYTHPNMPIWEAVTISMCYPGAYRPFKLNNDLWCDAGIGENYPIHIFNNIDKLKVGTVYDIPNGPINPKTLGIKLLSLHEKNTTEVFYGRKETSDIFSIAEALMNTQALQIELGDVSPSYIKQTIPISGLGTSLFRFEKSRSELIEMGRHAVYQYFEHKIENKENDE